ncbi:hypothetical protein BDZ88DRAFT_214498 [Geranomyces variabilis]|nr:hypothetical protein BDZ88DRAFT_214498 [Geranomyces variabilis]KAJ3135060.1 hypothetical protein HDU90_004088 [Geranomyces variabilis]
MPFNFLVLQPGSSPTLHTAAILSTGLFAGAALYITSVEHPARLRMSAESAQRQFQLSYPRAAPIQAALAVIGGVSSLALGRIHPLQATRFYTAGGAMLSIVAFTLGAILPTNKKLLAGSSTASSGGGDNVWKLLTTWGWMHSLRTAASLLALGLLVVPPVVAIA